MEYPRTTSLIRDWGFNWVRLPMDIASDDPGSVQIQEDKVVPIDRAIRLGEQYGIHVNVCLHRAPGFCVLDTLDEADRDSHHQGKGQRIHGFKNADAFVYQWTYFADATRASPVTS
jgi:endoglucanase